MLSECHHVRLHLPLFLCLYPWYLTRHVSTCFAELLWEHKQDTKVNAHHCSWVILRLVARKHQAVSVRLCIGCTWKRLLLRIARPLNGHHVVWRQVLLAWNSRMTVLSFRGTASWTNVLADLQFWLKGRPAAAW